MQKYIENSVSRSRNRLKLLHEFNISNLKREQLTDEVKTVLAARVFLQPGELTPTRGELRYVDHLFAEWTTTKTREQCIADLQRHYGLADKKKRGRPPARTSLKMARTDSAAASDIEAAAAASPAREQSSGSE